METGCSLAQLRGESYLRTGTPKIAPKHSAIRFVYLKQVIFGVPVMGTPKIAFSAQRLRPRCKWRAFVGLVAVTPKFGVSGPQRW